MKSILFFAFGLFVLFGAYAVTKEARAYANSAHVRTLRRGFTARQVVQTMGEPWVVRDSYFAPSDDSTFMYLYKSRFASSGNIELYLTKKDSTLYRIVTNE
jgi:outer membrane protein assembly factor BamE (lipoprotein component of BamABCDE complex)